MPPPEHRPLSPESLYAECAIDHLDFQSTEDLTDLTDVFGQSRAAEAIGFGLDLRSPGYNLFVLGDHGSGRHWLANRLLKAKAKTLPAPSDWCYVNNFADPRTPRAIRLPAGRGARLHDDMQKFVSELGPAITAGFESDQYRQWVEAIQEDFKRREAKALEKLGEDAVGQGIAIVRTPHGFSFAPLKDNEPMKPEEFNELPEDERARIGQTIEVFGERLRGIMEQAPRWSREMQARIRQVSRETLKFAAGHLVTELKESYADLPDVVMFLDDVMTDIVESGQALREQAHGEDHETTALTGTITVQRYLVNLVVDNADTEGAPVIYEDSPSYQNLIGRVDQIAQMGTLVTNFLLIKAGALHRANGGFLILDAAKLLAQPYSWEGLKRVLRAGRIQIESLGQVYGLVSTLSLEPEPVPIDLKIVLVGERILYYLLSDLDPDFQELFKIAADFESEVTRDAQNTGLYAQLIATLVRTNKLKPFRRDAVARVIEHAARVAGDAGKLTTHTRKVADLLREAEHFATEDGRELVARPDVEQALRAQMRRADRLQRKNQEAILKNVLLIDTAGQRPGQVNGLAATSIGDYAFGHPVRITATVRLGEGDIIDIEREVELGGAIHSKGVMILAAFLGARFARTVPLSLTASLVFEQSYAPVEGDSASLAELCALLSTLASAPIRQSLAVTGSVNQHGEVQAIGAVNEKIEGFFDICNARGLSGDQGVIVPKANAGHLMLRDDVVAAAREGKFAIYPVSSVDDAMEMLTGLPAGAPDEEGAIPEGSINYRVATQIAQMSAQRQAFGRNGGRGRSKNKR